MLLVRKMSIFLYLFSVKTRLVIVLYKMIYREERNLLEYIYVYIKKNFQSPKKRIFPKGVNPYF